MIRIVGAGMAGLLAANLLAHRRPVVHEMQKELPNNHNAVLRFRSPTVGDVLNIPFKKVLMVKDILPWKNSVADALAYSFKNTGTRRSDRSITAGQVVEERWIAPPDLIQQMAARANIEFGNPFHFQELAGSSEKPSVISTVPMPMLMRALGYKSPVSFNSQTGLNVRVKVQDCHAHVSLLVPDPERPFTRISITGDEMIVEVPRFNAEGFASEASRSLLQSLGEQTARNAARLLGLEECLLFDTLQCSLQAYAKILPVDDHLRKEFMFWATDNFRIFSLGRFATWRPGLLLDDLVKDIRLIDHWIGKRYEVARHR